MNTHNASNRYANTLINRIVTNASRGSCDDHAFNKPPTELSIFIEQEILEMLKLNIKIRESLHLIDEAYNLIKNSGEFKSDQAEKWIAKYESMTMKSTNSNVTEEKFTDPNYSFTKLPIGEPGQILKITPDKVGWDNQPMKAIPNLEGGVGVGAVRPTPNVSRLAEVCSITD